VRIHFYTMITSIIAEGLLSVYSEKDLIRKLSVFGELIDRGRPPWSVSQQMNEYRELSAKHTTHPGRRQDRQGRFLAVIAAIP
jgi:hypothetical protein